jgi:hypothetical protein
MVRNEAAFVAGIGDPGYRITASKRSEHDEREA